MAKPGRTKRVDAAQALQYLAKAEEWLAAAEDSLKARRFMAATGNAVHAGINAADAVCGARMGVRSAAQDHDEVLALVRQGGTDGADLAKHLTRLLPLKTRAEYDPADISASAASRAVRQAAHAVAIARRVVGAS